MAPRLRAFLIHLSASAFVLAVFTSLVLFWWYPWPLLVLQGGGSVLLTLLTVDVILGPTLTGIVYKRGKKRLVLDLAVIVAVQLTALAYGARTIYLQRPNYLAFTFDRYFLVSALDTVGEMTDRARFTTWRGNVLLATGVATPRTTASSLDELEHLSMDNLIPPLVIIASDLTPYPSVNNRPTADRGRTIGDIEKRQLREASLARLRQLGVAPASVRAFRVVGRKATATALVRISDGKVLAILR